MKSLADDRWAFRTVKGIADEHQISEQVVEHAIKGLGDLVRTPIVPDPKGRELFTLRCRRPRWTERYAASRFLLVGEGARAS